ncbi:MAG: 6-bladed beta-propeller [Candidatus Fermentibacteraceae bacterium]|nr:6-bladed beta-propeller [Candidatus Fermentibacteraceae bacterium]
MKYLLLLPLALLLITGCGSPQPSEDASDGADTADNSTTENDVYVLPDADEYLTVTDSIGIELGDSNFVFGTIVGAEFTKDGDIAILDAQKSTVSLFTPDGDFIRRIGRNGSGPGEFQMPAGMTFMPEGGLVVSDGGGGKLVYFDENFDYLAETSGFMPSPPTVITAISGTEIIGMKPDFEQNEDGMFMGFTVGKWNMESSAPVIVYYSHMSPFDPSDLSSLKDDIVLFTATEDGTVFTAPMSTEDYSFTAWTADGEEIFTFENEDFQRVQKTQTEIELEAELVNSRMIANGMPASMAHWEPDPYRTSISAMFVDGLNRLWVSRGTSATSAFDVYDLDGNMLFTAALDAGARAKNWTTIICRDSFICFDADPEDYPRVFYGELPGFE